MIRYNELSLKLARMIIAILATMAASGRRCSTDPCSRSFYERIFLVAAQCTETGPTTKTCDLDSGYRCALRFGNGTLDLDCDLAGERCAFTVDTEYQRTGEGFCSGACAIASSSSLMHSIAIVVIVAVTVVILSAVWFFCKRRRDGATAAAALRAAADGEYSAFAPEDSPAGAAYIPSPYAYGVASPNESPPAYPPASPDCPYGKPVYPQSEATPYERAFELP
jgi:hypothetical protein